MKRFLFVLPVLFISFGCATLHNKETLQPIGEDLAVSCNVSHYFMGRFAKVRVVIENRTDQFKQLNISGIKVDSSNQLKLLDPNEIFALSEGYNLRQSIKERNSALIAGPLVVLAYGAAFGLAASGGDPSGALKGAAAAGTATAIAAAPAVMYGAAVHKPRLSSGSPTIVPQYSREHLLGNQMLLAPHLALNRYLLIDFGEEYFGDTHIRFCLENELCPKLSIRRNSAQVKRFKEYGHVQNIYEKLSCSLSI